jgi:hypothetical protein
VVQGVGPEFKPQYHKEKKKDVGGDYWHDERFQNVKEWQLHVIPFNKDAFQSTYFTIST